VDLQGFVMICKGIYIYIYKYLSGFAKICEDSIDLCGFAWILNDL